MDRPSPAKTANLLNELTETVGCYYLSDLHDRGNGAAVIKAVGGIDGERYSLSEWREAAGYILETKDVPEDTVGAVKERLRRELATKA